MLPVRSSCPNTQPSQSHAVQPGGDNRPSAVAGAQQPARTGPPQPGGGSLVLESMAGIRSRGAPAPASSAWSGWGASIVGSTQPLMMSPRTGGASAGPQNPEGLFTTAPSSHIDNTRVTCTSPQGLIQSRAEAPAATGSMSIACRVTLDYTTDELKTHVFFNAALEDCLPAASGGFMRADEMSAVQRLSSSSEQMGRVLDSLRARNDEAFHIFVNVLHRANYDTWGRCLLRRLDRAKDVALSCLVVPWPATTSYIRGKAMPQYLIAPFPATPYANDTTVKIWTRLQEQELNDQRYQWWEPQGPLDASLQQVSAPGRNEWSISGASLELEGEQVQTVMHEVERTGQVHGHCVRLTEEQVRRITQHPLPRRQQTPGLATTRQQIPGSGPQARSQGLVERLWAMSAGNLVPVIAEAAAPASTVPPFDRYGLQDAATLLADIQRRSSGVDLFGWISSIVDKCQPLLLADKQLASNIGQVIHCPAAQELMAPVRNAPVPAEAGNQSGVAETMIENILFLVIAQLDDSSSQSSEQMNSRVFMRLLTALSEAGCHNAVQLLVGQLAQLHRNRFATKGK